MSSGNGLTPKERVLRLLNRQDIDRMPCFSGMGNVVVAGLQKHGFQFSKIHRDARQMALAAAATPQLFGFECAVVPFDMCIEAELMGLKSSFYDQSEDILYPTLPVKLVKTVEDIRLPDKVVEAGRIPVVLEAIKIVKEEAGDKYPVGAWVLGPFTLAGQVMDLNDLLKMTFKQPNEVAKILVVLGDLLAEIADLYKKAGADYITVREMGAPTDVLSPRIFKSLIQPHVMRVIERVERPKILHICGETNMIVEFMNQCGADAISVEQKNDIAHTRQVIGDGALLFGNIDGYNVMVAGNPDTVREAVDKAVANGVDAIWPGCDIWPAAPPENMLALVKATAEHPPRRRYQA